MDGKRKMKLHRWLVVLTLLLAACQAAPRATDPTIDTIEALDGKEDSSGELKLHADGLTLWMRPTVAPRSESDASHWILRGRISSDLSSVSAYSHDGTTGTVTIVSKRIFEVGFTHSELVPLIGGRRLFLTIQPTGSGKPAYYAMIELQPRFTRFAGSSSIFIYSWIDPVMDGFDLVFRGRVKTPRGVTMRGAFNDDDSEPAQTQEGETRWRYDWIPAALLYSGDPVEDAIRFGGVDADGASLQKSASIEIMLRRVSFTNYRTPFLLWPAPVCADAVLSCLQALESWPSDTEGCGTARQVTPCLAQMPQPPTPPIVTKEHFAGDLRKAIIAYYGEHESDILASGGNTRPQALLSVDTQRIDVVVDPDENALGYDLATHLVYRHPDVVFPGSDIVWFGVYRKSDGGLVELGPFN